MTIFSRSIFLRLLGVCIGSLAVIWGAFGTYLVYDSARIGSEDVDRDLQLQASALARFTSTTDDVSTIRKIAEDVRFLNVQAAIPMMSNEEFTYQVWDGKGQLLARSDEAPRLRDLSPDTLRPGRSVLEQGWVVFSAHSPDQRRFVVVGQSEKIYQRVRMMVRDQLIAPFVILAVGLSLLLWLGLRVGLAPLRRLAQSLAARDSRDLSPLAESAPRYAELKPLVSALDEKLARIRALLDTERAFFADAAHELRTPLAVIGAQAHVVAAEVDAERRDAAARELDRGIERASAIISRLLMLARLETISGGSERETLAFDELTSAIVDAFQSQANRGQRILRFTASSPAQVSGMREELTIAIEALLQNALQHTPPGTQVSVSVHRRDARTLLIVEDDGPGVAPADRERMFERFQRLDAAQGVGSGLGLAIARRIAELHGGQLVLEEAATGRGCRFVMSLP